MCRNFFQSYHDEIKKKEEEIRILRASLIIMFVCNLFVGYMLIRC